MHEQSKKPLYLGAYDNVWREALFAKLAAKHPDLLQVKQIVALYEKMHSIIGKGHLFTFFISDLPDDLRKSNAGVELFGLLMVLIFMDDVAIPLSSARETLDAR